MRKNLFLNMTAEISFGTQDDEDESISLKKAFHPENDGSDSADGERGMLIRYFRRRMCRQRNLSSRNEQICRIGDVWRYQKGDIDERRYESLMERHFKISADNVDEIGTV